MARFIHLTTFVIVCMLPFAYPLGNNGGDDDERMPQFYINITIDTNEPESYISLQEAESKVFNCTIHEFEGDKDVAVFLRSSDDTVFRVEMLEDAIAYVVEPGVDLPYSFGFELTGLFTGIENLDVMVSEESIGGQTPNGRGAFASTTSVVKVLLNKSSLANIITYLIYGVLILWFFCLGATLDLESVIERVKKPWGVIVGIVCQFTIMPPLALALAYLFQLDNAAALGLLLIGTCPGGNLSNTLSVMLDLDYALSVTMTCCTNLLALGMMPLNIFLYARFFTTGDASLTIPYVQLILQLILIVSPFLIGIFVARKFPKFKEFCQTWIKRVATITLIIVFACDLPFRWYVFRSSWQIYLSAILLPLTGTIIGTIVAKIACVETKSAVTIGLETGIQNALLAAGILLLFYPSPEGDLAVRAAYLCVISATVVGVIAALLNFIVQKIRGEKDDGEEDEKKITASENKEVNGNKVEMGAVSGQGKGVRKPDDVQISVQNGGSDYYYVEPDGGTTGVDNPSFVQ